MSRRKGELTYHAVDRDWPYQVALPGVLCSYENFNVLLQWSERRSAAPLHRQVQIIWEDDRYQDWLIYCFAQAGDVDAFMDTFGGLRFDPARDRTGKGNGVWRFKGEYPAIVRSGPLVLPAKVDDPYSHPEDRRVALDVPWPPDFMVPL